MFVVQTKGEILHGRASVVVNLQPPSKSVGRPRNSTHHLFPISQETDAQTTQIRPARMSYQQQALGIFVCLSCLARHIHVSTHGGISCVKLMHFNHPVDFRQPRYIASARQTEERYLKATPQVLIDILKCSASTDRHRSMGRQGFFGPGSQKRLPDSLRSSEPWDKVLLALSSLPLLVSTKISPRRYPRR